jgi:hypothetical protein
MFRAGQAHCDCLRAETICVRPGGGVGWADGVPREEEWLFAVDAGEAAIHPPRWLRGWCTNHKG